jgi:hypothetical protein
VTIKHPSEVRVGDVVTAEWFWNPAVLKVHQVSKECGAWLCRTQRFDRPLSLSAEWWPDQFNPNIISIARDGETIYERDSKAERDP